MYNDSVWRKKYLHTAVALSIVSTGCAVYPVFVNECRAEGKVTGNIANSLKGDWGQIKVNKPPLPI